LGSAGLIEETAIPAQRGSPGVFQFRQTLADCYGRTNVK
jgi:hypothetical protein